MQKKLLILLNTMEKIYEKSSFQTLSEISSSESFLSSLEIVINGRKNHNFIPYLQQILSPLPVLLSSFLFYTLIYIHFHLLMLVIILRLIVEEYITKLEKIKQFQQRFENFPSNKEKLLNNIKNFLINIKNNYLLTLINRRKISNILTNQENFDIAISNEMKNLESLSKVNKIESQDSYESINSNYKDFKIETNFDESIHSINDCEFHETVSELPEKENILTINDKNNSLDIDQEL